MMQSRKGWIDSKVKSLDDERYIQRFSVRRKNSTFSQINIERIRKLIAQKKMTKAGLDAVEGKFDISKEKEEGQLIIPADILNALKENKKAWENFKKFPESYKRIRIAYIESRRIHGAEIFEKSLKHFIKMTEENKRFGFVKEMI